MSHLPSSSPLAAGPHVCAEPTPAPGRLTSELADLWRDVLVSEFRKRHAVAEVGAEQAIPGETVVTRRGSDHSESRGLR